MMLLLVYTTRDQWKKEPPLTVGEKATALSLTVTNSSYLMLVIVMDTNTILGRNQLYPIHGQGDTGTPYNVLYNIPVAVVVLDLVASLPSYSLASQIYNYIYT